MNKMNENKERVFVTGVGGRFPGSNSMKDWWKKLCNGIDLVTPCSRSEQSDGNERMEDSGNFRYPAEDFFDLPNRMGQIEDINKFDNLFFGISAAQADCLDPQIRMLLESVFEAIADAGYAMSDLAGSQTGVYVGGGFSDLHKALLSDMCKENENCSVTGYENTGGCFTMFSNRISFCFDFIGPSLSIDTACSSSLVAFDQAMKDLKSGVITRAIVGGVSLVTDPTITKSFQKYNMLSPDGACQSFANNANGYVRSDAVGAVFIETTGALVDFASVSKPPIVLARNKAFAQESNNGHSNTTGDKDCLQGALLAVLGSGTNCDGFKQKGITFPSDIQQLSLFKRVFESNNLNPRDVYYVEAHGTGTTAGDGVELTSIGNMFCCDKSNTNPLLIGSVKSNMGHSEAASGLMSLLKVCCMECEGLIPPNLHYPLEDNAFERSNHELIRSGRVKVINKLRNIAESELPTPSPLVVVNNFGFGGTNASCVTSKNSKCTIRNDATLTRYIFGRSREALEVYISNNDLNAAAWCKYMRSCNMVRKYPWRGIVGHGDAGPVLLDANECTTYSNPAPSAPDVDAPVKLRIPTHGHVPVAFCYSGQGSQWNNMGKELYRNEPVFRRIIDEACEDLPFASRFVEAVETSGVMNQNTSDIGRKVCSVSELFEDGSLWLSKQWSGFGITMVQLGLTAMLNEAGIYPDYIFGHSVGEVACGYADGCLTAKQVAHLAFTRCECAINAEGLMMAVGVSLQDANTKIQEFDCTEMVSVACNNSPDGITFTGDHDCIMNLKAYYDSNNIFARIIPTGNIAYHSLYFQRNSARIQEVVQNALKSGSTDRQMEHLIPRSDRWISTNGAGDATPFAGSVYHTGNVTGMVNFAPVVMSLPPNTVVVEVGPHSLLKSAINRCNPFCKVVAAMIRPDRGAPSSSNYERDAFEHALDTLWLCGANIYTPKQNYLVPVENKINIQWDHDSNWKVAKYSDFCRAKSKAVGIGNDVTRIEYNLLEGDAYLLDHIIDGHPLFPATGHIVTVWKAFNGCNSKEKHGLCFKNIKILSAVGLAGLEKVAFSVTLSNVETDSGDGSGSIKFSIRYQESVVCTGHMVRLITNLPSVASKHFADYSNRLPGLERTDDLIQQSHIYSNFARHGYEYGPAFRLIRQKTIKCDALLIGSTSEWIAYLDNLLQGLINQPDGLYLPTEIEEVSIFNADINTVNGLIGRNEVLHSIGNEDVIIRNVKTSFTKRNNRKQTLAKSLTISTSHLENASEAGGNVEVNPYGFVAYGRHDFDSTSGEDMHHCIYTLSQVIMENMPKSHINVVDVRRLSDTSADPTGPAALDVMLSDIVIDVKGSPSGCFLTNSIFECLKAKLASYAIRLFNEENGICGDFNSESHCNTPDSIACPMDVDPEYGPYITVNAMHDLKPSDDIMTCHDVIVCQMDVIDCENVEETLIRLYNGFNVENDGFMILDCPKCIGVEFGGLDGDVDYWLYHMKKVGLECIIWFTDVRLHRLICLCYKPGITDMKEDVIYTHKSIVPNTSQLLVTDDYGYYGFIRCLRKEPPSDAYRHTRLCYIDHVPGAASRVGADAGSMISSKLPIYSCKYMGNTKVIGGYHQLCRRIELPYHAQLSDASNGHHIAVLRPGDLSSLCWVPNLVIQENRIVKSNCDVHYCGVNFKDVMLAYGKLTQAQGGAILIGLEFSGVQASDRTKEYKSNSMSRRVMGIGSGCMATKVFTPEHLLWTIPEGMSLKDACTIPVVYATAYYSLICNANIQPGQTVLIHSCAGGVGQAAHHLCKARGCVVIGTCSIGKREWVHEHLGLAYDHILDSRSVEFLDDVMLLTDRRGVDVVLNSLSGDKLHASLKCIAKYGHFCEIGKYDIQRDTAIGLNIFERCISFHAFDLGEIMLSSGVKEKAIWKAVHSLIRNGLTNGEIIPLKSTAFTEVEPSLRCMSNGQHIGKILVALPIVQQVNSVPVMQLDTQLKLGLGLNKIQDVLFRTHGTHIVIGGLGGFGLEMVNWLKAHGADKILIVSRSSSKPHHQYLLDKIYKDNPTCVVEVLHTNLMDLEQCKGLLKYIGHDLIGVWHLGMVLNDCLFSNMSDRAWDSTIDVKATICRNIDCATREFNKQLQYFVMWSSVSSLCGNPGQSNYGYANAAMEDICMVRQRDSLCGMAIQWGIIGNVGVLSNDSGVAKANTALNFVAQHIDSCLNATLAHVLKTASLCHLHEIPLTGVVTSYINGTNMAMETNKGSPSLATDAKATSKLANQLAHVLGEDVLKIKSNDTLASLGMDSLQSIEIMNILKKIDTKKDLYEIQHTPWSLLCEPIN